MDSLTKIDILFAGLILISISVYFISSIQSYLIKSVKNKEVTVFSSVISVAMINNHSFSSNLWGLIILTLGFLLFFYVFACGTAFISKYSKQDTVS